MNELNHPETTKHVIVHDNETFVYHIVEPQNCFCTGQSYMEIFDSEAEAREAFPQAFSEEFLVDNYSKDPIMALDENITNKHPH